jgi:hypothetical protein
VSEDDQWRQLGSIVNAVLIDAKTKAIRKGSVSKTPAFSPSRNSPHPLGEGLRSLGHGFLSAERQETPKPVQLELSFGNEAGRQENFLAPHARRTARLM